MGPFQHVKYSTAASAVLLLSSKSMKIALACLASGVLVDLDHILEYRNYCRDYRTKWDWNEFSTGTYFNKKGTVKVVFHSWEAALSLWTVVFATKQIRKKGILYGIAVGYTLHLILDEIGNNLNHMGYFEIYRWLVDWKQEALL